MSLELSVFSWICISGSTYYVASKVTKYWWAYFCHVLEVLRQKQCIAETVALNSNLTVFDFCFPQHLPWMLASADAIKFTLISGRKKTSLLSAKKTKHHKTTKKNVSPTVSGPTLSLFVQVSHKKEQPCLFTFNSYVVSTCPLLKDFFHFLCLQSVVKHRLRLQT